MTSHNPKSAVPPAGGEGIFLLAKKTIHGPFFFPTKYIICPENSGGKHSENRTRDKYFPELRFSASEELPFPP